MNLSKYTTLLAEVKKRVLEASKFKINIKEAVLSGKYIYDYQTNKAKYLVDRIKKMSLELLAIIEKEHKKVEGKTKNKKLEESMTSLVIETRFIHEYYLEPSKAIQSIEQIERVLAGLEKIAKLEKEISDFEIEAAVKPKSRPRVSEAPAREDAFSNAKINFQIPELPPEIAGYIEEDIDELQRCFGAKCYRSAMIFCGRILETALHRKYFEVTGKDALEKEPGIGLGKLIARLNDKKVPLDPGLPQQIHFINQVRIFSVHTKKERFMPSKNQAHATMLYTIDALWRMFPQPLTDDDVEKVSGARRMRL